MQTIGGARRLMVRLVLVSEFLRRSSAGDGETLSEVARMVRLDDIHRAAAVIQGVALRTPIVTCSAVARRLPNFADLPYGDSARDPLRFKAENLQRTGSFKIRGAYNRLSSLTADEKARGVAAVSAGNHAQGVGLAANLLGIKATIFMPRSGSIAKIKATEAYGASVVLEGESFDEAAGACREFVESSGAVFISPFDDDGIIAGQGTLGLELLSDVPDMKTLIVPVGGGGLFSGIAVAVKESRPDVRLIGVQSELLDTAVRSFKAGRLVEPVHRGRTICDGIAIKSPSPRTFEYISRYADDMVTVSDADVAAALFVILERAKLVVEPSGAAGVAAILTGAAVPDGRTVTVLCGGNIDMLRLADVSHREMLRAGHYLHLFTRCDDRPGGLAGLVKLVGEHRGNIVSVHHNRLSPEVPLGMTGVELLLEVRDGEHAQTVLDALSANGYPWSRLD